MVTGSGVESGAGGAAVFYQMPEGYVLGVPPGTPAFALPPKVLPGHGELFVTDCLENMFSESASYLYFHHCLYLHFDCTFDLSITIIPLV